MLRDHVTDSQRQVLVEALNSYVSVVATNVSRCREAEFDDLGRLWAGRVPVLTELLQQLGSEHADRPIDTE